MKIIGITGGIGSGKSSVAHILEKLGATVIDADIIAREVVQKGQKALAELVGFFGAEILDTDGNLDRKKLADKVFASKTDVEMLGTITHKYIREELCRKINEIKKGTSIKIIVIEAVIPFDQWFRDLVDEIWVVNADINVRIKRTVQRDGISSQQVQDRIDSQRSDEEYIDIADKVIINNGTREELERQVKELFER